MRALSLFPLAVLSQLLQRSDRAGGGLRAGTGCCQAPPCAAKAGNEFVGLLQPHSGLYRQISVEEAAWASPRGTDAAGGLQPRLGGDGQPLGALVQGDTMNCGFPEE